jgi:hypothetical protein
LWGSYLVAHLLVEENQWIIQKKMLATHSAEICPERESFNAVSLLVQQ